MKGEGTTVIYVCAPRDHIYGCIMFGSIPVACNCAMHHSGFNKVHRQFIHILNVYIWDRVMFLSIPNSRGIREHGA